MIRSFFKSWILLFSAAWLCGCGERDAPAPPDEKPAEEPATTEAPHGIPPVPGPVPLPEEPAPTESAEEAPPIDRAEVLGFARHMPEDVEALFTFHHAKEKIEQVRQMELWGMIVPDEPTRPFRSDDDEAEPGDIESPETMSALDFFGTEVTVALGQGSAERLASWLDFNRRSTYHQMRRLAGTLTGEANGEAPDIFPAGPGILFSALSSPGLYPDLMADPIASAALEAFQFPSIYLAVRAPDGQVEQAGEMLAEGLGIMTFFGEMVAPVQAVRAGNTFNGYRLIGNDMADAMEEGREFMDEFLGAEVIDRMIEFLRPREIVAMSGVIDDYAVLFLGPSVDEFVLAESPQDAVTAGDKLAFADPHLTHPFLGLMFGDEGLLESVATSASSLSDIAEGLRDGFAANDNDGGNRDLVSLLNLVSTRAQSLRALTRHEAAGVTMVEDGGLRIESQGGTSGMLDFSQPLRFADLADTPDVAMFLNLTTDPRYRARSTAYQEAIFQTTYALLTRLMEIAPSDDELGFDPFAMFRDYVTMFEEDYRGDLVNLWRATAHDMAAGLGNESAIVVDLKGNMPVIPGIPEILSENSKAPRITMLAPVADREKLASAWEKTQESGTRIVPNIGKMMEKDLIMPRPIRSESDGLSSWFLPLPFFDDDFLPSTTLNDEWFAMGTSRNHSIDLIRQLDALEPRDGGGLRFHVNFDLIAQYQREELASLEEQREAILESDEIDEESYEEMRETAEAVIAAIEKLHTLEIRCWEHDGLVRSRVHLRVHQE